MSRHREKSFVHRLLQSGLQKTEGGKCVEHDEALLQYATNRALYELRLDKAPDATSYIFVGLHLPHFDKTLDNIDARLNSMFTTLEYAFDKALGIAKIKPNERAKRYTLIVNGTGDTVHGTAAAMARTRYGWPTVAFVPPPELYPEGVKKFPATLVIGCGATNEAEWVSEGLRRVDIVICPKEWLVDMGSFPTVPLFLI